MIVRVPASLVQQRYPELAAQLVAPVKGRRPVDPSRVEWVFDYVPSLLAGCLANMLGRKQVSDWYHGLSEDDQVADFERHCTVHLGARQGQRVRRSNPLPRVPPEVLEVHRRSVRMEAEWREGTVAPESRPTSFGQEPTTHRPCLVIWVGRHVQGPPLLHVHDHARLLPVGSRARSYHEPCPASPRCSFAMMEAGWTGERSRGGTDATGPNLSARLQPAADGSTGSTRPNARVDGRPVYLPAWIDDIFSQRSRERLSASPCLTRLLDRLRRLAPLPEQHPRPAPVRPLRAREAAQTSIWSTGFLASPALRLPVSQAARFSSQPAEVSIIGTNGGQWTSRTTRKFREAMARCRAGVPDVEPPPRVAVASKELDQHFSF